MTSNTFIRLSISTGLFLLIFNIIEYIGITSDQDVEKAKQEMGVFHAEYNHDTSIEPKATLLSAPKIVFHYHPQTLEKISTQITQDLSDIAHSRPLGDKIQQLSIDLHEPEGDLRGQMKQAHIKLFGVGETPNHELISIFIHELSHYIDIYFLKKKVFQDPSSQFYAISWQNTNTIIGGQKNKDFVSGYAMTNKYEDFAESMTYYIFANEEMRERAKNSFSMKQKYSYFERIIFKNKSFKGTDFSTQEAKRYYWDITKKTFDMKKFLEYLQNEV